MTHRSGQTAPPPGHRQVDRKYAFAVQTNQRIKPRCERVRKRWVAVPLTGDAPLYFPTVTTLT